tara:strand:- start:9 stop:677 length:669 start_codon:yes stop_codon:yes gene_type:complete
MSQGWIKLHRAMLEWEWYDDLNVSRLFIHCLLKANHKDNKYKGKLIERGSFITGFDTLAKETSLSVQKIRTAINKLKSTSDLTIKSTSQGTLIQVVNYNKFQEVTNEPTNDQQTNNKRSTTNNNDKNKKNEKKEEIDQVLKHLNEKLGKKYRTAKGLLKRFSEGYSVEDAIKVIDNKIEEWGEDQKMKVYLTPDTLFSEKFDKYLNQESTTPTTDQPEIYVI